MDVKLAMDEQSTYLNNEHGMCQLPSDVAYQLIALIASQLSDMESSEPSDAELTQVFKRCVDEYVSKDLITAEMAPDIVSDLLRELPSLLTMTTMIVDHDQSNQSMRLMLFLYIQQHPDGQEILGLIEEKSYKAIRAIVTALSNENDLEDVAIDFAYQLGQEWNLLPANQSEIVSTIERLANLATLESDSILINKIADIYDDGNGDFGPYDMLPLIMKMEKLADKDLSFLLSMIFQRVLMTTPSDEMDVPEVNEEELSQFISSIMDAPDVISI